MIVKQSATQQLRIDIIISAAFHGDRDIKMGHSIFRSSHSQMFFKTSVLKNFAMFTGKHLFRSLLLIKFQA